MEILVKLNNKKKIFILLVYNFTKNMTHLLYKIIFIYKNILDKKNIIKFEK